MRGVPGSSTGHIQVVAAAPGRDSAVARSAGRMTGRIVPVGALSAAQRDSMWRLFRRYYTGVSRTRFDGDLSSKQHAVLLHDRAGGLRGFSTLLRYRRSVDGRRFLAIYSGDTIVEEAFWGNRALQHAFGAYITRTKLLNPCARVYWFLVSKGYKTYLLLSRNFPEHWPRKDGPTPPFERAVIDALARERFGPSWDPRAGVVRADADSGRLRDAVAPVEPRLLADPDIRFFAERNPGHARGDELACLGRVRVTSWARYILKQTRRRTVRGMEMLRWAAS